MKKSHMAVAIPLLVLLAGCGSDSDNEEQSPQGILTGQQLQALEGANSVEQTLLDAAAGREKELEARLQRN